MAAYVISADHPVLVIWREDHDMRMSVPARSEDLICGPHIAEADRVPLRYFAVSVSMRKDRARFHSGSG
jgi:hypothetical protein